VNEIEGWLGKGDFYHYNSGIHKSHKCFYKGLKNRFS